MLTPDFGRMLDVMLTGHNPASVTLTQAPTLPEQLLELLDIAIHSGESVHNRLTRIEMPKIAYPEMGAAYREVPVSESGHADVVRLFFAPPEAVA